ncbi:ATP-binding protein [Nonomuraea sp. NN258]|uniref:ATP-binding protein n=1 Tax=Nonomuraea antri TaxID=2730852 RepID=UPI0015691074|nr:ATP-binding protein [Nonomuraea antri]NRQ39418.1 ATP-binding protein [Nonomuraea antri]
MNETEERALHAISRVLNWATTAEHAWNPPPFHVGGMHARAEQLILDGIDEASENSTTSPLGVVIQGEGGAGKTHLLGWVREQIARVGGYFFLVDFSAGEDFWRRTTSAMVEDLGRSTGGPDAPSQAMVAVRALAALAGVSDRISAAGERETGITREDLDALVHGLVTRNRQLLRCRDTIRALALYAAASGPALDVAHDHLMSTEEAEEGDRKAWGMSRGVKEPHDIAVELSMILALTGPSVIAVDQIDAILEHSRRTADPDPGAAPPGTEPRKDLIDEIAAGLMALVHATQRTLCLVACLPSSWNLIGKRAIGTVQDRFRPSLILTTIDSADIARTMVERRFAVAFANAGFTPPSPVWPVAATAFATAPGLTPRTLLRVVSAHVSACRAEGGVRPLERFDREEQSPAPPLRTEPSRRTEPPRRTAPAPAAPHISLARLDACFADLRGRADVSNAFDPEHEDELAPALLAAGLHAWIKEQGKAGDAFSVDPPPGHRPTLHARLRQALDPDSEEQRHWTFRMIAAPHHRAALKRLNDGMTASGLAPETPDRHFIVLRNSSWSDGPTTQARLRQLKDWGGRSLTVHGDDLRVFEALRQMAADADPAFETWLRARRPASGTELFSGLLSVLTISVPSPPQPSSGESRPAPKPAPEPAHRRTAGIPVGRRLDTGADLELNLSTLTRHTAVFAGSGSGKTVFLRRLIEECALHGVSSIVLDSNNDLARLGDPWPSVPPEWSADDKDKAARYFAETEVVIWTPGRSRGRPLVFQPLPDFAAVLDDRDELNSALGMAVEALATRANVDGASAKAQKGKAILRQALEHFARRGGGDFTAFLGLLAALPLEVSQIDRADQIAAELGQLLTAATINDPLFAGRGEPADPQQLLTPSSGKRARVSVISFIGLNDDARPGFVNQLQMALFSWIKRNPACGRALNGLYVMDEAQALVPASPKTEALASTLTLASQARKYGLGLVFATQTPRGLHNHIAGNATTQFIGRMNSPTQITVVQGLARARGGRADRVGRLETGQFYAATDGISEVLIRAPQCLSHHPADPLTEQEIIDRASA